MPWAVELVDEVDSTNRVLLERARAGAQHGVVLVAGHQTAGRGRLDRSWESAPGSSLLVSVLLRSDLPLSETHLLTMAAGLAAAEACERAAGVRPSLKWPNDLVVGEPERKLAGLLAESVVESAELVTVVIGMGLNLNWPHPMPPALDQIATSLNHHSDVPVDRNAVLSTWLEGLDRRLGALEGVLPEYRSRCATLGRAVRVELMDGSVEGVAGDVDDDGRLVVQGATTVAVSTGDVVHLRTG